MSNVIDERVVFGFRTIPGSPQGPQEMPELHKHQGIFSLVSNPVDNRSNMPTIEEHENLLNSDEDDEHAHLPVDDDGQIECKEISSSFWWSSVALR